MKIGLSLLQVEKLTAPAMRGIVERIEGTWRLYGQLERHDKHRWFFVLIRANAGAVQTIEEKILRG